METPSRWRRVKRPLSTVLLWAFGAIALYAGLMLASNKNHKLDAWLLALTAAYVTFGLGMIVLPFVVALGSERIWPPPEVPPPPQEDTETLETTAYVRPPDAKYPLLAHARGQCGWVKLRLRVDRLGRIDSYEVAKQAPDGVFEHAVAAALFKARLPPDPDAAPLR